MLTLHTNWTLGMVFGVWSISPQPLKAAWVEIWREEKNCFHAFRRYGEIHKNERMESPSMTMEPCPFIVHQYTAAVKHNILFYFSRRPGWRTPECVERGNFRKFSLTFQSSFELSQSNQVKVFSLFKAQQSEAAGSIILIVFIFYSSVLSLWVVFCVFKAWIGLVGSKPH